MKLLKQAIGVDVSKDTFNVKYGTIDIDFNIKFKPGKVFKNNLTGIKNFIDWFNPLLLKDIPHIVVMEATGVYYENLAFSLAEIEINVSVLLPNKAKSFFKSLDVKSKTDDLDAMLLSRMGLERKLPIWKIPDQEIRDIKALTRERNSYQKKRTAALNQLHSYKNSFNPPEETTKRIESELAFIETQVKEIEKSIEQRIKQNSALQEQVNRISKVSGISALSIVIVIAETNQFALINNVKQLVSYAGLDVQLNQSGTINKRSRISKKGNAHIRKALYMPALSASKHNKTLNDFYTQLNERKKTKKIGVIAVERKLLILIYSLWKSGKEYDPNYKNNSGNDEILDSLSGTQHKKMDEKNLAQI